MIIRSLSIFSAATSVTGTSMDKRRYEFSVGDSDYVLWAWKGDYINLGAGAELGIYQRKTVLGFKTGQWDSQPERAMPMTLRLSYTNGKNIFSYEPDENQWWINGFNAQKPNIQAVDVTMTVTVDFSDQKDLWENFEKSLITVSTQNGNFMTIIKQDLHGNCLKMSKM